MDVAKRADVGTSGYEKIVGTIHFALDPRRPAQRRHRRSRQGAEERATARVEFSADLYILRPKDAARSNGVALVEVSNRGRKGLLSGLQPRARRRARPADGRRSGRRLPDDAGLHARVGRLAVRRRPRRAGCMKLDAPIAAGVSGDRPRRFHAEQPRHRNDRRPISAGYSPVDPAAADTTLTVRDGPFGEPQPCRARSLDARRATR